MRALLLAAGFGSRLGDLTKKTPKCLMKINNVTMLDHWIEKLGKLGVDEFIINTHYLADNVSQYIDNHPLCHQIHNAFEAQLLGTSRTLLEHASFLSKSDSFIVHVDNYCDDNLEDFLKVHLKFKDKYPLSMLAFYTLNPTKCGILQLDDNDVLQNFHEKPSSPIGNLANAAVYLASSQFFKEIRNFEMTHGEITLDVIPKFVGRTKVIKTHCFFEDMGTVSNFNKVKKHATSRNLEI